MLSTNNILPVVGLSVLSIVTILFFTLPRTHDTPVLEKKVAVPDARRLRFEEEPEPERKKKERGRRLSQRIEYFLTTRPSPTVLSFAEPVKYAYLVMMEVSPPCFIFFKSPMSSVYQSFGGIVRKKKEAVDTVVNALQVGTGNYIQIEDKESIRKVCPVVDNCQGFFISIPPISFRRREAGLSIKKVSVKSMLRQLRSYPGTKSFSILDMKEDRFDINQCMAQLILALDKRDIKKLIANPFSIKREGKHILLVDEDSSSSSSSI